MCTFVSVYLYAHVCLCVCVHECVSVFVRVVCGTYTHACMCGVCVVVCANIALQIGDILQLAACRGHIYIH